jgi:hypothetical protein
MKFSTGYGIAPRVKEVADVLRHVGDRQRKVKEVLLWHSGEPYRTESLWKREAEPAVQSSIGLSGGDEDGLTGWHGI